MGCGCSRPDNPTKPNKVVAIRTPTLNTPVDALTDPQVNCNLPTSRFRESPVPEAPIITTPDAMIFSKSQTLNPLFPKTQTQGSKAWGMLPHTADIHFEENNSPGCSDPVQVVTPGIPPENDTPNTPIVNPKTNQCGSDISPSNLSGVNTGNFF